MKPVYVYVEHIHQGQVLVCWTVSNVQTLVLPRSGEVVTIKSLNYVVTDVRHFVDDGGPHAIYVLVRDYYEGEKA